MLRILTTALVVVLVSSPLLAHGGQYKGPSDAGQGGPGAGGTVAPPTNPGGANAPGPGGAQTAGATAGGSRTGGGRQGRGGSDRKAAVTSGGLDDGGKGFEIWEFWWENNKDRFLNLKSRLNKNQNVSGSPGQLTSRGRKGNVSSSRRPSRGMINDEVVPTLRDLLTKSDDSDILDSSVLALGRMVDPDEGEAQTDAVVEAILPLLGNSVLSVQSSTALALGVLGSPRSVAVLQDLLQDSSNGQRLAGGGSVHWLVRSFSALSLGLIGDPDGVATLIDIAARLQDSDKDIKICAIVGLGLLDGDHPKAGEVRTFLEEQLRNKRLDPLIKSFVPTSLGKLGMREAVPALLAAFNDRDTDNIVRQSCAIGLGQIASPADSEVIEALSNYVKEGGDEQSRHFSLISLGEIGANDADADPEAPFHAELRELLFKELSGKGKQKSHRSWASLAGAIYARAHEDMRPQFVDRILSAYGEENDPSFKAAFAVSLGLLSATSAGPQIFEDFTKIKDLDFRGYSGIALGFLQYNEAAEPLRNLCRVKNTDPTLRLQAATGLGLMSDTQAVETLIATLEEAETLGVSSAVAKALGIIGDQESISPLAKIAVDEQAKKLTRAFACVALGIVGEKTELPWNAAVSASNNYRAKTESIEEVLDIL